MWLVVLVKLRICLYVLVVLWNRCLFFSEFRFRWFRNGWLFCGEVFCLCRNMWLLFWCIMLVLLGRCVNIRLFGLL